MNALLVRGEGRVRSPAAAGLALEWPGVASGFAGIGHDADERPGQEQVGWADRLLVMERGHRVRLTRLRRVDASGRRVVRLDVPDRSAPGVPALAALPRTRLARHLA